jgi:lipopolysaccharide export system protein LptA
MKSTISYVLLAAALCSLATPLRAEKADRNKPMNIEADTLRYDDLKQLSIFTGRVVLTKGTIIIRGARLEVRQDPDGYQFGLVTGSPDALAFFRQKREAVDEFMEGEGETIYYDGRADTVTFTKRAQLRRYRGTTLGDEVSGAVIVYENLTDMFSVDGGASNSAKNPNGTPGGRVRAMLIPKPEGAPSPTPVPPATLRPSTTLGGTAK